MVNQENFDDIRPLNDTEVHEALSKLSQEPQLMSILMELFPKKRQEELIQLLASFHTIIDFQKNIIRQIAMDLASKTTKGFTVSGLEKIENSPNRLFISNHRDIILDSVFLNVLLLNNGKDTCEIAIGNNLFVKPWIETLVRINKSIVVKRNVPVRQMLEVSHHLSSYIRHAICDKQVSVWIAQREGRAKDSNDRTQDSLLKMFNMSGKQSLYENMQMLNISPVSISYEYDPCDYLKAKEFQLKRDDPDYKKTPQDDALNMQTGLKGWKGKIHYHISSIDGEIDMIKNISNKNEQISSLSRLIDKHIHQQYQIFPSNMIAYDLLHEEERFTSEYSKEEKKEFEKYINTQLNKIDIPNKDISFLQNKMMEMYANPLINHLKSLQHENN